MNNVKLTDSDRAELEALQLLLDQMRKTRGVSPKDEILTHYPDDDDNIIAEADGFGGADLLVVGENYPFDFLVLYSYHFDNEEEACTAAVWLDWALYKGKMDRQEFFHELERQRRPWVDDPYDEGEDPR